MKTISKTPIVKTAIVALMTATIGFTAIVPTFAQDAAAPIVAGQRDNAPHDRGPGNGGDILGFEQGAEGVEIALVRLSHSVELTTEQQPLFDTFKTEALKAATTFAAAVEGLRPVAPVAGETPALPDPVERLDNSIALQTARLAALKAVQPSATAFFNSLTEEQKVAMAPMRPERDGGMLGKFGPRHLGPHGGPEAGGAPVAPPAPVDAPTPPPANG